MYGFFVNFRQSMFVGLLFIVTSIAVLFSLTAAAAPDAKLIEFWNDHEAKSVMIVRNEPWQEILDTYVDDEHPSGINRFDYKSVSDADVSKLREYIAYLQLLEPRQFNSAEAKAYWLNLYNALMVDIVINAVREDDIKSIKSLGSRFWRRDRVNVVMQDISLDDIEHGILRPIWKDARIHYALATGALGGGNLQKLAYTGANIESQLVKAEKDYLNHDRGIRLDGNRAIASSVFDWYRRDFVASKSDLVPYIAKRVDDAKRAQLLGITRVSFDYDWTLNSPDSEE